MLYWLWWKALKIVTNAELFIAPPSQIQWLIYSKECLVWRMARNWLALACFLCSLSPSKQIEYRSSECYTGFVIWGKIQGLGTVAQLSFPVFCLFVYFLKINTHLFVYFCTPETILILCASSLKLKCSSKFTLHTV